MYGGFCSAWQVAWKRVTCCPESYATTEVVQEEPIEECEEAPVEECCEEEHCDGCSIPCDLMGEFEVTYYCDYGLTATGTTTHMGTCGVDPNVIPLGSTIFIEYDDGSIRECVAEDTGGAVKGNIIDVWLESYDECIQNGRDICKVYLVKE